MIKLKKILEEGNKLKKGSYFWVNGPVRHKDDRIQTGSHQVTGISRSSISFRPSNQRSNHGTYTMSIADFNNFILTQSFELAENIREGKDQVYFNTYSAAVQSAKTMAENRGYTVNETDWFNKVSTGPKKPSKGKTNKISLGLHVTKSMKLNQTPMLAKKGLHIQVYNRGASGNTYELNAYIN